VAGLPARKRSGKDEGSSLTRIARRAFMLATMPGDQVQKRRPRCGRRPRLGALIVVAALFAMPSIARAAGTFYARGAVVLLSGAPFTPTKFIDVGAPIDIGGRPGAPRPLIEGPPSETVIGLYESGARLHDVDIHGSNDSDEIVLSKATAERISVVGDGYRDYPCVVDYGATLADSVCLSSGWTAISVSFEPGGATNFRNVTAIGATGGLEVRAPQAVGLETAVEATNLIAAAGVGSPDVQVLEEGPAPGGVARVELRNSDYDSISPLSSRSLITPPGTNGNITAPPLFVNPAAGDLRELPGSPTVDAGLTEAANGEFDLDLDPRASNGHPTCEGPIAGPTDIGAYELVVPVPTCAATPTDEGRKGAASPPPPAAPGTTLKKAKIDARKGAATFTFGATGTATGFACELVRPAPRAKGAKRRKRKRPKFAACGSPEAYKRLAPGRYTFKVEATGPGGTDATPASKAFTIGRRSG
jgi:hypothetical protein